MATRDGLSPRAWLALCAAAAALALLQRGLPPGADAAWDWQPDRAMHEPWRLFTAALVHLSPGHLAANLLALALVAMLGHAAGCGRAAALAWAAAWPLTHALLWWQAALVHYGGLSGVLHAAVAVAAMQLLWRDTGRRRAIGAALLAGLLLKVLLEAPWAAPVRQVPGWDFPVASLAHATGTLAGMLTGALAGAWALRTAARASPACGADGPVRPLASGG